MASFSNEVTDVNSKEVMELLVLTQYFDVLRDIGMSGKSNTVSRGELVLGYRASAGGQGQGWALLRVWRMLLRWQGREVDDGTVASPFRVGINPAPFLLFGLL